MKSEKDELAMIQDITRRTDLPMSTGPSRPAMKIPMFLLSE
jgi:hypothetical protein